MMMPILTVVVPMAASLKMKNPLLALGLVLETSVLTQIANQLKLPQNHLVLVLGSAICPTQNVSRQIYRMEHFDLDFKRRGSLNLH